MLDYLFYQNLWLMFLALPVTVFFLKWKKQGLIRERKKNLNYQFKDALNALSVSVQAGYSVENAVNSMLQRLGNGCIRRKRILCGNFITWKHS